MIDIKLLHDEKYQALLLRKEPSFPLQELLQSYQSQKDIRATVEALSAQKNELAKQGATNVTPQLKEQALQISNQLKAQEAVLAQADEKYQALLLSCPNLIADNVPAGGKESNLVVSSWGEKANFNFEVKNHVELNAKLKWFDMEIGAQLAGSGFVFYNEFGTKLIYALTRLLLRHNKEHGFTPVLPPYAVSTAGMVNNGSLPKFQGDFYDLNEVGLSLLPTAEVALTNIFANQTFLAEQLPLRRTSWTPCFRREAGTYGSSERGLIRIHQFEKVELYSVITQDQSADELEKMVNCGKSFIEKLGLHYRVSLLAAQDTSFVAHKTYDLEVWLPGQKAFYEVSSCSNCTDFQSRRAKIKYKVSHDKKPELAHTLNASSLALPRLIVALMETYQQADGSIVLPKLITDEMNNLW